MAIKAQQNIFLVVAMFLQYFASGNHWRKTCLNTGLQSSTSTLFSQPAESVTECTLMCVRYSGCVTTSFDRLNLICNGFAVNAEFITGAKGGNMDLVYHTPVPEACRGTGWEWVESQNFCVRYVALGEEIEDAKETCRLMGGDLVQLHTTAEFNFFVSFVDKCWKDCQYLFVGADRDGAGYKWYDGTAVGDVFCDNEPSLLPTDVCLYFACPGPHSSWCTYTNKRLDDAHCFKTTFACMKTL